MSEESDDEDDGVEGSDRRARRARRDRLRGGRGGGRGGDQRERARRARAAADGEAPRVPHGGSIPRRWPAAASGAHRARPGEDGAFRRRTSSEEEDEDEEEARRSSRPVGAGARRADGRRRFLRAASKSSAQAAKRRSQELETAPPLLRGAGMAGEARRAELRRPRQPPMLDVENGSRRSAPRDETSSSVVRHACRIRSPPPRPPRARPLSTLKVPRALVAASRRTGRVSRRSATRDPSLDRVGVEVSRSTSTTNRTTAGPAHTRSATSPAPGSSSRNPEERSDASTTAAAIVRADVHQKRSVHVPAQPAERTTSNRTSSRNSARVQESRLPRRDAVVGARRPSDEVRARPPSRDPTARHRRQSSPPATAGDRADGGSPRRHLGGSAQGRMCVATARSRRGETRRARARRAPRHR